MSLKQPTGIILQTNVAIVKYKVGKQSFEIACYKNKAINWRNGVEKDLEEVLQSEEIYKNTSHGTVWKMEEISTSFPGKSKMEVIHQILEKGDLQIGDKQREMQTKNMYNDVVNIIADFCVHPESKRPFSVDSISQAIKDIHFPIKLDQSAKKQALECIKELKLKYNISRAEMQVKITVPSESKGKLEEIFQKYHLSVEEGESQQHKDSYEHTRNIEPSFYRNLNQEIKETIKNGSFELLASNLANREIKGIEDAGTVNLELNPDWHKPDEISKQKKVDSEQQEEANKGQKESKQKKTQKKKSAYQRHSAQKQEQNSSNGDSDKNDEEQKKSEKTPSETQVQQEAIINTSQFKCSHCQGAFFETNQDYKMHYQSEWHTQNLKRKGTKKPILEEKQYQLYQLDLEFSKNL